MKGHGDGPDRPRGRRSREQAREEILDVAERLLRERSVSELTVGELMEDTSIGRSAFYLYFRDRYHMLAGLLERLEAELLDGARPWLGGARRADPLADVRSAIERTVAVWVRHGPVLRAITEAASHDERVAEAYRAGLLEHLISAVAQRIQEGQALGRIRDVDARETASALVFMNERYLADRLGSRPTVDAGKVTETLYDIWTAVLYGRAASPGDIPGSRQARTGEGRTVAPRPRTEGLRRDGAGH